MAAGVSTTGAGDGKPRVAVTGTGRMGAAMAVRPREAGFPATAYNRTRAKAEATGATARGDVCPCGRPP
ncbi:NAD(P)-binding domain-containing protein [Streptomyces spinosirectus]